MFVTLRMLRPYVAIVSVLFATIGSGRDPVTPPHLSEATKLLAAITPAKTNYQHKEIVVTWPDAGEAQCRTDCSGLLDAVLKRSYHLSDEQLATWFGAKRPLATHYHSTIERGRGFLEIKKVAEIQPGDILAIKYPPGGENTGHVMLVADKPRLHNASAPLVENTQQWEVDIIDSTRSAHGSGDTRMHADKSSSDGLGKGTIRIYANENGEVAGYTWSVGKSSKFSDQATHSLAIGRVMADAIPERTVKAK